MPIQDLKVQISKLPEQPGVYLYFNGAGDTIYVGKASVLRDRVRSYLSAHGASARIDALLDDVESLEIIVTDSVAEALALENNLIKHRAPKYNVLLRDDKNYPYLQLTTNEAFPRVLVSRRVQRDGAFYAGPFLPTALARKTMLLTHRLFGIRSCNEVITGRRDRPCLEYDIKRCLAPCVANVCSQERYAEAVEHTRMFLEGRNHELLNTLTSRMTQAAKNEHFEQAAEWRDAIRTIKTLRHRQQKMSLPTLGDRDAFGMRLGPAGVVIHVFQMRRGRVIDRIELIAGIEELDDNREEYVVQVAVQQFYEARPAPPEVLLPTIIDDLEAVEEWLSERAKKKVHLSVPKRGNKRALLDLASRNATIGYKERYSAEVVSNHAAIETLRVELGLATSLRRIECFDISTIQGSDTVGAMVVCENGRMERSAYRKFKIRGLVKGQQSIHRSSSRVLGSVVSKPDDFSAMHEIVFRRYRRLLEEGGPFPDLIVIDGGKGQLSASYAALEELGLSNLIAVGLVKKKEVLVVRDRPDPITLPSANEALLLLQRIRDEAHRCAVTFHRRTRTARHLRSALDSIPGVGLQRRRTLLTRFGSVAGVRRASREELMTVVGARVADAVLSYFAAAR
jgi:excinuclease ABC subunit C